MQASKNSKDGEDKAYCHSLDDLYRMNKVEVEKKILVLKKAPEDLEDENNLNQAEFFQVKKQIITLNSLEYETLSFYNVS